MQTKVLASGTNSTQNGQSNANSVSSRPSVLPNASSIIGDNDGEIKKFYQEGTPSWMSKSNSNTNLSTVSPIEVKEEATEENLEDFDDSSDDDELLNSLLEVGSRKSDINYRQVKYLVQNFTTRWCFFSNTSGAPYKGH